MTSVLRSPTPASPALIGDYVDLSLWVHEHAANSPDVTLNPDYWPGINDGDVVRITELEDRDEDEDDGKERGYLFTVRRPREDTRFSNTLQVSPCLFPAFASTHIADRCSFPKVPQKHLASAITPTSA